MDLPTQATSLGDLLPEHILLIAKLSRSHSTRSRLARTCRDLYNLLNPELYRRHINKALDWAARTGNKRALQRALSYHTTPLRKTRPMFTAIEHAHYPIVKILLATPGVNIEATNHKKLTALEVAVRKGRGPIVKHLLDVGADTEPYMTRKNTRTNNDEGPLACIAARRRFSNVLKHLINSGRVDLTRLAHNSRPTALTYTITYESERDTERLLEGGVDPNTILRHNKTALHLALDRYYYYYYYYYYYSSYPELEVRIRLIKLLLRYGADPMLPASNPAIDCAIRWRFAHRGHGTDAIQAFLDTGKLDEAFRKRAVEESRKQAIEPLPRSNCPSKIPAAST
ncbi:ankyrin repeat-containing domain protein [Aspergillus multicolor]|uniref:ankyrin repeat domain-containing protein n=1 Tax=Aspergillus multicolor TaxID=41759 RepID=UPI003CCD099A